MPIISQFYGITVKIYFEEGDRHHTEHINYNKYEKVKVRITAIIGSVFYGWML